MGNRSALVQPGKMSSLTQFPYLGLPPDACGDLVDRRGHSQHPAERKNKGVAESGLCQVTGRILTNEVELNTRKTT